MPSSLYSGAALYKLHTDIATPDIGWNFYKQLAALGIAPRRRQRASTESRGERDG